MRLDWYSSTVNESLRSVLGSMRPFFAYGFDEPVRPFPRYDNAAEFSFDNDRLFRVDEQDGKTCLITASSDTCPGVVEVIRKLWPVHNVSRLDACQDYTGDTVFEDVDALLVDIAMERGTRLDQCGDWLRKTGRTRYVGSRTSVAFLRWYEKGKEQFAHAISGADLPEDFDVTRSRFEVQLRPPSRDKQAAATYTPQDVFAYADWTKYAFGLLSGFDLAPVLKAQRKRSPHERRVLNMCKQYGPTFLAELSRCHGSPDLVVKSLLHTIHEIEDIANRRMTIPKAKQ